MIARLVLVLVLLSGLIAPALGHEAPEHRPRAATAIEPRTAYPFRLVAAGGGHFHALFVGPRMTPVLAGTHLGLFRSYDRGVTWRLAARRFGGDDVHALARDPHGGLIYAATHDQGLLVSRDGGATWRDDTRGLPGRDLHALALDPRRPVTYVWAVGHGLLRREGERGRWERLAGPAALDDVQGLAVHPDDGGRLYAATAKGVWTSTDGGRHWSQPRGALRLRAASVAVPPGRTELLLAATGEGVFVGDVEAADWRLMGGSPSWWGPLVGFAFLDTDPGALFAVSHEGVVARRRLADGAWEPLAVPADGRE
jgi:hypothetical protein